VSSHTLVQSEQARNYSNSGKTDKASATFLCNLRSTRRAESRA